ncbi:hypothetical protein RSJ2_3753 (plasmid) [Clostridium botulinum]|uniref:hypothetical protein n=2 Tax=Clostridium botulinum TaxID=1491 RepID=UPI0004632253|nr:hypothetical protein [Clostridium botulinum]APR02730.1 hypothetical protein RSJ2_3753 [Clostridium botulinum]AUN19831.1 hypothetical protein B2M06_20015 [Clostridium botulinum]NFM84464.1 hypothetical protein [Clostridium botulinum]NFP10103.1 hypothetical protein [Clostridium botulinum]NFR28604.1 hypothetical protein [Clostridium botulinum]
MGKLVSLDILTTKPLSSISGGGSHNYNKMTYKKMAIALNKSISSVKSKLVNYFGICKREEKSNVYLSIKNVLENANRMDPGDCIKELKRYNIKDPKNFYKSWRKKYIKSRVL